MVEPRAPRVVLPHILVQWAASTTEQQFVRYNVYRREAGETEYVRVAWIDVVGRLDYRDYAVKSRTVYEYTVTISTLYAGEELESLRPDPVQGSVVFDWTYIHDISDPPEAYCAFYSLSSEVEPEQEVEFRKAWGRQYPTAFVGELEGVTLRIRGLPDVHRGEIWEAMRGVFSKQRTDAALYCVRPGVTGEKYFANIATLSKSVGRAQYEPSVDLVETYFDEAV